MLPCIYVHLWGWCGRGATAFHGRLPAGTTRGGVLARAPVFLLEEGLVTDNHWTQKKGSVMGMSKSGLSSCSSQSRACGGRSSQGDVQGIMYPAGEEEVMRARLRPHRVVMMRTVGHACPACGPCDGGEVDRNVRHPSGNVQHSRRGQGSVAPGVHVLS